MAINPVSGTASANLAAQVQAQQVQQEQLAAAATAQSQQASEQVGLEQQSEPVEELAAAS